MDIQNILLAQQQQTSIERTSYYEIISNLCSSCFQITLGYICLDIIFSITLHFVALEIGQKEAAGVGLDFQIIGVLIMPIGIGINECLNMLVSQALGANQKQLPLSFLNLNLWIHLMYIIPLSFILYASKDLTQLLIPLIDRKDVIESAWEYLPWVMLSTYFAINFEGFKCYLLAHKIFYPFIIIHIVTTVFHYFNCYLFITVFEMKLKGAGLSLVMTEATNIILLIVYIKSTEIEEVFIGFKFFQPFQQSQLLVSYVKNSIPMILHIFSIYVIVNFVSIYSMQFGTQQFYALIILYNINFIYFRFSLGLNYALLTYVGSEMGKKQHKVAQQYTIAGCLIFMLTSTIFLIPLYVYQSWWLQFFADEEEVFMIISDVMIIYCFSLFCEGMSFVISGPLKGIDMANFVSKSTIIVFYAIAFPIIFLLIHFDMKIIALWLGYGFGNIILVVIFTKVLLNVDWVYQEKIITEKILNQSQLQNEKIETELSLWNQN